MITKNEIKRVSSLKEKKFRTQERLFVVEGEKMVEEALSSNFEVLEVYRTEEIGEEAMSRMSALSSPSPALAVCRQKVWNEAEALRAGCLYLALDGIKDPGNLGTILRIADWFGVEKVFLSEDCVEIYNPKVVQSTMGAIFRVPFEYCDLAEVLKCGCEVLGTFLDGENIYSASIDSGKPIVIVIGSESFGIREKVAPLCKGRLTIPSYKADRNAQVDTPECESLNAAIATAIAVAEVRRRL
ncbi:MAG: RNA methyltransferase [Bacteroidales bacterium]|nr:RNA methyltransferase [Bacteroidales bacterium]